MEGDKSQQEKINTQWLFDQRLQFLDPQESLGTITLEQFYSCILAKDDIEEVLKLLNNYLLNFYLYDQTNSRGNKGGKGQGTKKKNSKETEKQGNKVKKFLELFRIDSAQEQDWKKILKTKNITTLLNNVYSVFFYILQQNFELVQKIRTNTETQSSTELSQSVFQYQLSGFASLKNKQLRPALQFRLCVLVLDIIRLIKTIRLAHFPYNDDQFKKLSASQQQEREQLDTYFEAVKEPKSFVSMYRQFKNPTQEVFIQALKQKELLLSQQSTSYKLWLNIYQLKKNYLIDETNGLLLKKSYKSKLQTTVAKQLQLYWIFVSNQYRNSNFGKENIEEISLQNVFEDYTYLFANLIDQAVKNEEKIEEILNFFNLIAGPWKLLDQASAIQFYWKCMLKLAEKIKLPTQYLQKNYNFIMETCHFKIGSFYEQSCEQTKQDLQDILLSLSKELIYLSEYQSFKDYLQKNKNRVLQVLQKYKQCQNIVRQCKKMIQEVNNQNVFTYIHKIQEKLQQQTLNIPKLSHQEQQDIFIKLYEIFQKEKDIVDEIKHFMEMSNSTNLQECREFYRAKRQRFSKKGHIETQGVNLMRFGIVSSIRVATFELITTIKLQENQKIHQNGNSKDSLYLRQQELQRLILKLLKVFQMRKKYLKRESTFYDSQPYEDNQQSLPLLRRISSLQINPNQFQIEQFLVDSVERETQSEQFEDNQSKIKFLKNIFEIKLQMIQKKVLQLQQIQRPLRKEYQLIKKRVYEHAAKNFDFSINQALDTLPKIQYELTKKRFWSALRQLTNIKNLGTLEDIQKILQVAWGKQRNILRIYVTLLIKYRHSQQQRKQSFEITNQQATIMVNSILQGQKIEGKQRKKLRDDLLQSIRILSNFEQVQILKKERREQMDRLKSIEDAKKYEKSKNDQNICFGKWLEGKLFIIEVSKNGVPITKKYTITPDPKEYENVLKKVEKLTKLNRNITLTKQERQICLHVDQHEIEFQSYPKLVKYLIQSYYQTVQFCHKNLQFELYPLVWSKHIKIEKVKGNHPTLRFNPYEGIILNLLLTPEELKSTNLYRYPQFPFVEFAEQINILFMNSKHKVYSLENQNADYHAFVNLIEEMKSLSLEQLDGNLQETFKSILKCPYFWSSTEKFYELVEFKERYHNNVNIEQSRRKENQKIRTQLYESSPEQYEDLMEYLRQKEKKQKHPKYKTLSSYNRTTQIYLSIEGLVEKQAFEEDIGNFRQKNAKGQLIPQDYKYHAYWWIKGKKEIEYLLELVSQRQKRKGSNKSSVYEKTFNSFQNQIRNLRNLAVHYIYDSNKKKEINIQEKIRIFQQNFPKLFVFIYRWKPFLGKDYNVIQAEKINLLCSLFPNKENNDVIQKLESINEFEEYNIPNFKVNRNETSTLLQQFKYDRGRANDCYLCGLISMLLFKQSSFWGFLSDAKYPKEKDGKQVLYNVLFWDHQSVGCNGMQYLERAFYNVSQRNQFTSQELAHVRQSQIMLQLQKQKIQRKLQRIRNNQDTSDEQDKQYKETKESVEVKYHKLTRDEKDDLHEELAITDYVPKYFIFQLEMRFPYLFSDLRRFRYLWDRRAKQLPAKIN